jgi:hypothetical protein
MFRRTRYQEGNIVRVGAVGFPLYIELHWGSCKLSEVPSVGEEKWLRNLAKSSDEPYSRPTKAKIRNIMSAVFNHAIRYEFLPQGMNPIALVRQSAKRMQAPDVLDAAEVTKILPTSRSGIGSWCSSMHLPGCEEAS